MKTRMIVAILAAMALLATSVISVASANPDPALRLGGPFKVLGKVTKIHRSGAGPHHHFWKGQRKGLKTHEKWSFQCSNAKCVHLKLKRTLHGKATVYHLAYWEPTPGDPGQTPTARGYGWGYDKITTLKVTGPEVLQKSSCANGSGATVEAQGSLLVRPLESKNGHATRFRAVLAMSVDSQQVGCDLKGSETIKFAGHL